MSGWDARYLLDGQAPEEEARQPLLNLEIASPAFFQTLGIEIVRGRAFTDEDSAEGRPVVILSESAARLGIVRDDNSSPIRTHSDRPLAAAAPGVF